MMKKTYLLNVLLRQHLLDEGVEVRDFIMLASSSSTAKRK